MILFFATTENCKNTEQQYSEIQKSRTKNNDERRKYSDLRPFRVVTIVPLQSLQSHSREGCWEGCWDDVCSLPVKDKTALCPDS